ncbi:MAG: hypothetical protein KGM16_08355 [Bacteroidota bacterium]|nr:hypothetical protein [Bacteroidota bacterium]
MNKFISAMFFLFLPAFIFAQYNPKCEWTKEAITVDGNVVDWNPPLRNYDSESQLFFDFKNDDEKLYLCFQTKGESNQEKIMKSGMKIILSSKINGKHKSIIDFPLRSSKVLAAKEELKLDPLMAEKNSHHSFIAKDTLMELKGFANTNGIVSSRQLSGARVAINWDSANTLNYEVAIPLKELFGNDFDATDLSKEISLTVVINALPAPRSKEEMDEFNSSERMKNGGQTDAVSEQQKMAARYAIFQKTELKQKFFLAKP